MWCLALQRYDETFEDLINLLTFFWPAYASNGLLIVSDIKLLMRIFGTPQKGSRHMLTLQAAVLARQPTLSLPSMPSDQVPKIGAPTSLRFSCSFRT